MNNINTEPEIVVGSLWQKIDYKNLGRQGGQIEIVKIIKGRPGHQDEICYNYERTSYNASNFSTHECSRMTETFFKHFAPVADEIADGELFEDFDL